MRVLTVPILLLAGCGAPAPEGNQAAPAEPAAVGAATTAAEAGAIAGEQRKAAPSNTDGAARREAIRWTGRFAASEALCQGGVWDITETAVRTDGETSCTIDSAREEAGRVELALTCVAEGCKRTSAGRSGRGTAAASC